MFFFIKINDKKYLGVLCMLSPRSSRDIFCGNLVFSFLSSYLKIPSILLVNGASNASQEEVEAKKAKLKEEMQKLDENRRERELENEQHSREGDNDDPNEGNTGKDLETWDELIKEGMKTIVDIIN